MSQDTYTPPLQPVSICIVFVSLFYCSLYVSLQIRPAPQPPGHDVAPAIPPRPPATKKDLPPTPPPKAALKPPAHAGNSFN